MSAVGLPLRIPPRHRRRTRGQGGVGTLFAVSGFVVAYLGFFVWIGDYVDRISGVTARSGVEEITVDPGSGETLFWGRGTCGNCHRIGTRGSNTRCPDLAGIGAAAATRVEGLDAASYLVQSIVDPAAFEVEGFKPTIMPKVYETVPLGRDEILAILSYLQIQGGEEDIPALEALRDTIPEPRPASRGGGGWGDPARGEQLFFDLEGKAACARCHRRHGTGETTGPDLSDIGRIQPRTYLLESILFPSTTIVAGYEQYVVKGADGTYTIGMKEDLGDDRFRITTSTGETRDFGPEDLAKPPRKDKSSMMPENFHELISMQDVLDLVAYLESDR